MDYYPLSSHYAQAYYQHLQPPSETVEASSSSTYSSRKEQQQQQPYNTAFYRANSSWYQPGPHKCTHPGCSFTGSQNSLELHRMDRHLIFPPGWEKHSAKAGGGAHDNWDADPSLKGQRLPIQGTSITLDDPDVLEAWIAERKRRWPTQGRVQDKKRKLEEAIERGQLVFGHNHLTKKDRQLSSPRLGLTQTGAVKKKPVEVEGEECQQQRLPPVKRRRLEDDGQTNEIATPALAQQTPSLQGSTAHDADDADHADDDDDDGPPETLPTKITGTMAPPVKEPPFIHKPPNTLVHKTRNPLQHHQPKPPPKPFVVPPPLLRNLLLPEIHNTVSNLSQVIRFLVDNDFLQDVESTPGDAQNQNIQVLTPPEHQ